MTARRHMLNRDKFPMLSQFLAGYLHQDFAVEHGTPAAAKDAFLRDASATERSAFFAELEKFRSAADALPWSIVQAAVQLLGGAWRPPSRQALNELLAPSTATTTGRRSPRGSS
jgi:hypothetical protein